MLPMVLPQVFTRTSDDGHMSETPTHARCFTTGLMLHPSCSSLLSVRRAPALLAGALNSLHWVII